MREVVLFMDSDGAGRAARGKYAEPLHVRYPRAAVGAVDTRLFSEVCLVILGRRLPIIMAKARKNNGPRAASRGDTQARLDELVPDARLQERMFAHLRSGERLLAEGSPFQEMLQTAVNRILEAELDGHLADERAADERAALDGGPVADAPGPNKRRRLHC